MSKDDGRTEKPEVSYSVQRYAKDRVQFGFLSDWPNGNHDHWFAYSRTLGMDGVEE